MWDFKFDAPKYYNFFRPLKCNAKVELDMSNPNDIWFLQ